VNGVDGDHDRRIRAWSFLRRRTKGVIIFLARETRSCASNVTLESPLALNTALSDSRESASKSGKIKFMRDYIHDVK
jgi:hypothetical protein